LLHTVNVKSTIPREAGAAPGDGRLPAWILLALAPIAALGAVALWLRAHWAEIPERFPVHWGLNGQPDGWSTKSFHDVYGPLWFGAGLIALILMLGVASYYGSRQGPMRLGALKILVAASWLIGYVLSVIGLLPVFQPSPLLFLIPIVLFVIGTIWWSMRMSKMDPGESTPDECWHAGLYYNPADPALCVQKRMGFGFTFNFANRLSWVVLGGFLAGIAGLILLLR
jgi:uncharacterized membrane protein